MTARSALAALFFLSLSSTIGCRDDVNNIVSSVEPDGGIIIDPGRGDRGVRDGGGAADEGTRFTDGGDRDSTGLDAEGMLIRRDGGGEPTMDMGPAGGADVGVSEPDVGVMMFPDHPLPPSQCGYFGPREALHANPARIESYRHSSPGEWFNEPALYGCTPPALAYDEGEGEARVWQRFEFEYDGIRAEFSRWRFGEGMEDAELTRTIDVNRHGLVTAARYGCEDGVNESQVRLEYDGRGRLVEYTQGGEMGCPALNTPLGVTVEYDYEGEVHLPSQFIVRVEAAGVEVINNLTYTWDDDRITRIDITTEGMEDRYRLFVYDADGRIEREEVWRPEQDKADREISYSYDDRGRLSGKRDSDLGHYRFHYTPLGDLSGVDWPNGDTLIARGHPERVSATTRAGP